MAIEDVDLEELGRRVHALFFFTFEILGEANRTQVEAECEALMCRVQGNRKGRTLFTWSDYLLCWVGAMQRCQEILADAEAAKQ